MFTPFQIKIKTVPTALFQMFHDVSVLFSDVVGFTHICSLISPMEVVTMLNNMYTVFDQISEQHNVYKVSAELSRKHHIVYMTCSLTIIVCNKI